MRVVVLVSVGIVSEDEVSERLMVLGLGLEIEG